MNLLKGLLVSLMLMISANASAYDFKVGGIYYYITNQTKKEVAVTYRYIEFNGSYIIEYKNDYKGDVKIPSSVYYNGRGYKVTSISDYAFYGCDSLTSISIPENVARFGTHAFYGCNSLNTITIPENVTKIEEYTFSACGFTSIKIPDSVTSIGGYAFHNCSKLTSITIPKGVTQIGDNAFTSCASLMTVNVEEGNSIYDSRDNCNAIIETKTNKLITGCNTTIIPNTITTIASSAFAECTDLESISIPNSVTSIEHDAFSMCSGLTSITIPNSVTSISENAFAGCSGLTSITIPNSVTSIGDNAFRDCSAITTITIPQNVTSIATSAFTGCVGLTSISVENGNSVYDSRDNCNAIIKSSTNTLITGCQTTKIPNTVTVIGYSAFYGCTGLKSISIPNGVIEIRGSAFEGCRDLNSVSIPNSVTSIGTGAFYNCALTSVTIPGSVSHVGHGAFYCANLSELIIEDGASNLLFYISYYSNYHPFAFSPIKKLHIGRICHYQYAESELEDYSGLLSFSRKELEDVEIGNGISELWESAFKDCSKLTSLTIGNKVKSIGKTAFDGCSNLKNVTIKDGMQKLTFSDEKPFKSGSIKTLYLGRNTSNDRVFSGITTLQSVEFGDSINTIASTFSGCTGLTSVTIPSSVTSIGSSAFEGCTGLTSITIPNSVMSIGGSAFYGCSSLPSVDIPSSVTSIGRSAFGGCTGLTFITIPNSVMSIGESAFADCSNVSELTIENGNKKLSLYNSSFKGMPLKKLHLGRNLNADKAFKDMITLENVVIGDSVTSIVASTFSGCTGLTSVDIPNCVTSVGKDAYAGCTSLSELNIADGKDTITFANAKEFAMIPLKKLYLGRHTSGSVFSGNTTLENVVLGDSIVNIGEAYFSGCSALSAINIPSGVASIGKDAFNACNNLKEVNVESVDSWCGIKFANAKSNPLCYSHKFNVNGEAVKDVVIPDGMTSIGDYVFYGNSELTSVAIPNSVTNIGSSAFNGCEGLTSVTIPGGVTSVGAGAFAGCKGIAELNIQNGQQTLSFADASPFNGTSVTKLFLGRNLASSYFKENPTIENIVIGDSVTTICEYAFYICDSLASVTIPSGVKSIGREAFNGCNNLKEVHIDNIAAWCGISFYNDNSNPAYYAKGLHLNGELVRDLTIPGNVSRIGSYAFYRNTKVKTVTIEDGVTDIGNSAFGYCPNIFTISLPNSVENIGDDAFYGCRNLMSAYIPNADCKSDRYGSPFNGNTTVFVPKNSTFWSGWWGLTTVEIDYDFVVDGFYYKVDIPSLTASLVRGWDKYNGDVAVPETFKYGNRVFTVTAVNDYALAFEEGVTSIELPASVRTLGANAMRYNRNMTNLTLPNEVKEIPAYAFYQCSGLESVALPDSLTSIGESAFAGCRNLTELALPGKLATIANAAYQGCNGLTTLSIPASVTRINENAFAECANLHDLTLEDGTEKLTIGYDNFALLKTLCIGRDNYSYFANLDSLHSVTIGEKVQSIAAKTFTEGFKALENIYTKNPVPCELDDAAFTTTQYLTLNLYVPTGSLNTYMAAKGWMNFFNIYEYDATSGIDGVVIGNNSDVDIKTENGNIVIENVKGNISVYSLSGAMIQNVQANGESVRINVPSKGMYIIKTSKGAKKIAL